MVKRPKLRHHAVRLYSPLEEEQAGEEGAEAYFLRKTGESRREKSESDADEGEEIKIEAHGTLIA